MKLPVENGPDALESAIKQTGQHIIDYGPGWQFDASELGRVAMAYFSKERRSSESLHRHIARVSTQVAGGAVDHLVVQEFLAAPSSPEELEACVSGTEAVSRFHAETTDLYAGPSEAIAAKLNNVKHPLHPVRRFLLQARSDSCHIDSNPEFDIFREGSLQSEMVDRSPDDDLPATSIAESISRNVLDLTNHVIVLRALAHTLANQGKPPPGYRLHQLIQSEIGELSLLNSGVLQQFFEQLYGRGTAKEVREIIKQTDGRLREFNEYADGLNWDAALTRHIGGEGADVFDGYPVDSPLLEPKLPEFKYRKPGRCLVRVPWRPRLEHASQVRTYFDNCRVAISQDGAFSVNKFQVTHSNNAARMTIFSNQDYREGLADAAQNIRRRQRMRR